MFVYTIFPIKEQVNKQSYPWTQPGYIEVMLYTMPLTYCASYALHLSELRSKVRKNLTVQQHYSVLQSQFISYTIKMP